MPSVSVVIPALNEADNLRTALPLVQSQLGPTDEVVVVDNGSIDSTANLAREMGAVVISEPVRGRSTARNAGFRRSRGELVVFLDADCRPEKNWLSALMASFGDPKVGCVAGEITVLHGESSLGRYLSEKRHLTQEVNFQHPFLPFGGSGNIAFRRVVLERIGLFDEKLFSGHDADLCWRMQLETDFKIVRAPEAIVYHAQNLTPRALIRQKRRHGHGSVLLFKKYQYFRQNERKPLKQVYWEYRSILRRAFQSGVLKLIRANGALDNALDQHFQLLLEIGEKLGRLEGSIRNRVWFP